MAAPKPITIVLEIGALDANAAAVDTLARLRLATRRLGCCLELRGVTGELAALLAFLGLDEAVLGVEARRQAEEREQRLGVEEERELGDPLA